MSSLLIFVDSAGHARSATVGTARIHGSLMRYGKIGRKLLQLLMVDDAVVFAESGAGQNGT